MGIEWPGHSASTSTLNMCDPGLARVVIGRLAPRRRLFCIAVLYRAASSSKRARPTPNPARVVLLSPGSPASLNRYSYKVHVLVHVHDKVQPPPKCPPTSQHPNTHSAQMCGSCREPTLLLTLTRKSTHIITRSHQISCSSARGGVGAGGASAGAAAARCMSS